MFIMLLILPFMAKSQNQILKERRVYYLDCSYSMVSNKLWDPVRENLKNAIDNVDDETTELVVVPFAFDAQHHPTLNAFSAKADKKGKSLLKSRIDGLEPTKRTMTYHSDVLNDFYGGRDDDNRVTYMFLMTDGRNEENPDGFIPLLKKWGGRCGDKNVYGFYVMLHASAANPNVERTIDLQPHFWVVPTADVNLNLIRLQDKAVFNARNDKYIDLQIYGDIKDIGLETKFDNGSKYQVGGTEIVNGKLRVHINFAGDVYSLPASQREELSVKARGIDPKGLDFFVTDKICVECISKPEKSLRISIE